MHFLTVTAPCEFKLKPCQASYLQNRKQAVSAFFTCILDGTQIKPVHSITSCVATHKNQRPLNTYKFYHLDGTFQPTLHQLVLAQLRCQQRQIAPLHPTATQLHWHQHSSQQALPHAYLDLLISNNNIKSSSNKQSLTQFYYINILCSTSNLYDCQSKHNISVHWNVQYLYATI